MIAELTAENLALKRGSWYEDRRYSEEEKKGLLATVERAQQHSGQPLCWILAEMGLTRSVYYDWLEKARTGGCQPCRRASVSPGRSA